MVFMNVCEDFSKCEFDGIGQNGVGEKSADDFPHLRRRLRLREAQERFAVDCHFKADTFAGRQLGKPDDGGQNLFLVQEWQRLKFE